MVFSPLFCSFSHAYLLYCWAQAIWLLAHSNGKIFFDTHCVGTRTAVLLYQQRNVNSREFGFKYFGCWIASVLDFPGYSSGFGTICLLYWYLIPSHFIELCHQLILFTMNHVRRVCGCVSACMCQQSI